MDNKKMKINEWPRHGIQALWAALTNSHISGFVTGKDLDRKIEKCLCSGAELLFLPRGKRGLSHWFPSGCDRKLELQDGILCSWISDLCRSVAWKTGVRISLPLWTDPGIC